MLIALCGCTADAVTDETYPAYESKPVSRALTIPPPILLPTEPPEKIRPSLTDVEFPLAVIDNVSEETENDRVQWSKSTGRG